MKKLYYILLILIVSCTKNPKDFKQHITGYWEIKEVTLNDGTKKQYNFNNTIDYIEINDTTGFRKKMKPNLDGTFQTSNNLERFTVKVENDSLNLYYKTPFSNWKETILHANNNQLQVINKNKDLYLYQRYTPITLD
ncbi:lipocalin family protein [Olleya sp. YS]|uniref:lipocalin family protein n=1 Tax=Olleya sp. YS TaxID=3028318 RepID=UPI0024345FA3|nr:lipocalin family protein [Olleya sp. YS]WGD35082.1 lipocalin family protein [Olleya sp. YS]